jgi:hypothetical protein
MVELIMFFALGFLVGSLLALTSLPLLHARAERLAVQRLSCQIPWSIKEARADKDALRAEFAIAAYRYERTIDLLRTRLATELAELGRKSNELNRLKRELAEQFGVPEARNRVSVHHQAETTPTVAAPPIVPLSVSPTRIEACAPNGARISEPG